ncbi:MAG TPA: right-handed parallel beta-helix repeat-containing protein [Bacteroidia bacterium]
MKKIFFLFCIANLFFVEQLFSQTNYYVNAATGNDANSGTNLAAAWKTIQKACSSATPNSVVQIKGGTYHENISVNVSGTAGNPITFRNYMSDSVFIDGTGTGGTTVLYMQDKNYLNFQHLVIQNLTVNNAQGIAIECSAAGSMKNISFKNIIIRHINWTSNPASVPTSNDNSQAFIAYGYGSNPANAIANLAIDSCEVYSNILGFSEGISLDGNINGFSVTNCKVHDNTNIGIDVAGNYAVSSNPAVDHARNGVVRNCECCRNVSNYATSAGIYVDGGWNTVIEKCKSYENGWGIEVGCEENGSTDSITVKNNLIYNNKEGGLAIGGYTSSTTGQVLHAMIRNNTFFENNSSSNGNGEIYMTKMSNSSIINNIFYTNAQNQFMFVEAISPQASNALNYNCWFTPNNDANNVSVDWRGTHYATFASYKSGTAQEANSFYGDPALSSPSLPTPDLHIPVSSLCYNAGDPSTVISPGESDYEGNARIGSGRIDVGAYEVTANNIYENNSRNTTVKIYPDPFTESATVQVDDEGFLNINLKMKIYDGFGREIKQLAILRSPVIIERSHMPDGIYFYYLLDRSGNSVSEGKFIVR